MTMKKKIKTEAAEQENKNSECRLHFGFCFLDDFGHFTPWSQPQFPHLDPLCWIRDLFPFQAFC